MSEHREPRRRSPRGRRWPYALLLGLSAVSVLGLWSILRPPPPVPEVATVGYDPLIAEAIAQAREAVLKAPRSAEARGRMGMILLAHEVLAPARECLEQASLLAPAEPRWPYYFGMAQLLDNPLAAVTNLDRAVRRFPEDTLAPRLRLASTLVSLGRFDEAERHFRKVLEHQGDSAVAALGLGKISNARGRMEEALGHLSAARLDPSTRKAAHRLLLNAYQLLGRTNETAEIARTLARLPNDTALPDPFWAEVQQLKTGEQAWIDRSDEWIKAGRPGEAAQLLEKTVQTYPQSDRAMFFLGRARLRLGDAAGAEAILKQAVALAPGSIEAQMQLGVTLLSQYQPEAAETCFRAAIQIKPNLAPAWFNLALCLGGTSARRQEALAAFREALRLKPDLVEAYLGLAVVLRAEGDRPRAAHQVRTALLLDPPEPLRSRLLDQLKLVEP